MMAGQRMRSFTGGEKAARRAPHALKILRPSPHAECARDCARPEATRGDSTRRSPLKSLIFAACNHPEQPQIWAHNPKVGGSNPPPATKPFQLLTTGFGSAPGSIANVLLTPACVLRRASSIAFSYRLLASLPRPGNRCPYVSNVMLILEWPI